MRLRFSFLIVKAYSPLLLLALVDIAVVGQGVCAALASADAHHIVHGIDEDQPIAGASGGGNSADRLDRLFHVVVAEHDVELDAGQHVDLVTASATRQRHTALPTMSTHFKDIHPNDADLFQGVHYIVEPFFTDDCFDFLCHKVSSRITRCQRILGTD